MKKYDIFISYRREGGAETARILCERFTEMGYRVFFDVEELRSGDFNKDLYSIIENCNDFLLILSHGALDRCEIGNDWVRNELSHALKHGKNIVPVMLRGFSFPQELPDDIDDIRYKNGVEASIEFFDAFVEKLQKFLKSKPFLLRRILQNPLFIRTLPFFIALFTICLVFVGGYAAYKKMKPEEISQEFPHTQTEKNIVSELLGDVMLALLQYNLIVAYERDVYEECAQYLISENPAELEGLLTSLNHSIVGINKTEVINISADLSNKLDDTPIDKADTKAFFMGCDAYKKSAVESLRFIKFIVTDSVYSSSVKKKIVNLYIQQNELTAKYTVCYVNGITLNIDPSFLSDFKKGLTPFTSLPYDDYIWLDSEEQILNQLNININKLSDITNQLTSIIGNQNVEYANEVEDYRLKLKELGFSKEQIDKLIAEIVRSSRNITDLKSKMQLLEEEVTSIKDNLQAVKEEASQKFAVSPDDDEGTLWGKMLRFLMLNMPDEAITCLKAYGNKVRNDDSNAAIYIPVVETFIRNIPETCVDYGVIVVGFVPGKDSHEIYEMGDIIVAINGKRCLNFDSYKNAKIKDGDVVTILRYENNEPAFIEKTVVPNQSKVQLAELTERDIDESSLPFEGLDENKLWALMTEKIGAYEFQPAIDCAQMYHMKVRSVDKNSDIYIPVIKAFIQNMGAIGVNFGVIVTDAALDSKIKVGDIVTEINGHPCLNRESYNLTDGSVITIMRRNPKNLFDFLEITVERAPDITVRDLSIENK